VALAHTVRYEGPWELPPPPWLSPMGRVYLRLLFRAGLLTNPQGRWDEINAEANSWANLLFADTVEDALKTSPPMNRFTDGVKLGPTG
jgi:hypothetical protein